MSSLFLSLFLIAAAFNWLAAWRGRIAEEYFVKPAAIVALMLFAASRHELSFLLGAALSLCLLGDVLLMLPGDKFLPGLVSFLFGQIAYSLQFPGAFPQRMIWFALVSIAVAPVAYLVLRSIRAGGLRMAVCIYAAVISMMAASAIGSGSLLAAAAGIAFLVSDSILAIDHFVKKLPRAHFWVMLTYHQAQLGLVLALT